MVCLLYLIPSSIVLNFPSRPKPSRNKRATVAERETKTREHVGSTGMRSRPSSLDSRLMSSPREPLACSVHSTRRTDTGDGSSALHRHRATRDKCAPHIHTSSDRGGAIMLLRAWGLGQALGPSTGPVAQYSPCVLVCFYQKNLNLI